LDLAFGILFIEERKLSYCAVFCRFTSFKTLRCILRPRPFAE
jgi:hypothetical protein